MRGPRILKEGADRGEKMDAGTISMSISVCERAEHGATTI